MPAKVAIKAIAGSSASPDTEAKFVEPARLVAGLAKLRFSE